MKNRISGKIFSEHGRKQKSKNMSASASVSLTVSVALCTYNGERFLPEQLASLEKQTRLPNEVVVCDDGSRDRTLEILENWKNSVPFPVRIFRNSPGLGASGNFQKAMGLCTCDVVFLCDQDDVWLPEKVHRMTRFLEEHPEVGIVYCNAEIIEENGCRTGISREVISRCDMERYEHFITSPNAGRHQNPAGCCAAVRGEILQKILPFHFQTAHDSYLYHTVPAFAEMATLPDFLLLYRCHRNNTSIHVPLKEHLKQFQHFQRQSYRYAPGQYWFYRPLLENYRETIRTYPDSPKKRELLKFYDEQDRHFSNRERIQRNFLLFGPLWALEIGKGRYFTRRQPLRSIFYDAGCGILHGMNPVRFVKELKSIVEKVFHR